MRHSFHSTLNCNMKDAHKHPSMYLHHSLQIQSALERVRAGADVMPRSQLEGQLVSELGRDWSNKLAHFDWTPRAAASIGQVHAATLHDGTQIAMKIQYPGRDPSANVVGYVQRVSDHSMLQQTHPQQQGVSRWP